MPVLHFVAPASRPAGTWTSRSTFSFTPTPALLIQTENCHLERRLPRTLRQSESKDLRLLFSVLATTLRVTHPRDVFVFVARVGSQQTPPIFFCTYCPEGAGAFRPLNTTTQDERGFSPGLSTNPSWHRISCSFRAICSYSLSYRLHAPSKVSPCGGLSFGYVEERSEIEHEKICIVISDGMYLNSIVCLRTDA